MTINEFIALAVGLMYGLLLGGVIGWWCAWKDWSEAIACHTVTLAEPQGDTGVTEVNPSERKEP
jgi:ABC-type xylose transport system permease subunit